MRKIDRKRGRFHSLHRDQLGCAGGDEEEKDANTGCFINIPKVSERSELTLQFLSGQKLIENA